MRHGAHALVAVLCVTLAACGGGGGGGGGGTGGGITPSTPTIASIAVTGAPGSMSPGQTAQLTATATWSDSTTSNVTNSAAWQTSNASAATVNNSGLVTAVGTGSADISASSGGKSGSARVQVANAGGNQRYTLSGTVRESNGNAVNGATVRIEDGANAGKRTNTDANGRYSLTDLVPGTFTLRIDHSDTSYQPVTISVTVSGDTQRDVELPRQAATIVADPGGPYQTQHSIPINFSGINSTSSPNPIARFQWNCGQNEAANCNQEGPTPTFIYHKCGISGRPACDSGGPGPGGVKTYTVTLTVTDTKGNSNTRTTTVKVTNDY